MLVQRGNAFKLFTATDAENVQIDQICDIDEKKVSRMQFPDYVGVEVVSTKNTFHLTDVVQNICKPSIAGSPFISIYVHSVGVKYI